VRECAQLLDEFDARRTRAACSRSARCRRDCCARIPARATACRTARDSACRRSAGRSPPAAAGWKRGRRRSGRCCAGHVRKASSEIVPEPGAAVRCWAGGVMVVPSRY
jgi:hypothetical protein